MTQKSLPQTFNESAAAAHEAFPEKLDNLLVLVTSSDTPVYVSPEIAEHVSKNPRAVKEAVKEATEYLRANGYAALAEDGLPLAGHLVKNISFDDKNSLSMPSPLFTEEMQRILYFNHEIGHLVVENGLSSFRHQAECAADAYAVLRHVQRFGKETDIFKYYTHAGGIILDVDRIHYTDDVIQRISGLVEKKDISGLSLRQTADLAGKIASECELEYKTLLKISDAFQLVTKAYEELGGWNSTILLKCIEVMQDHQHDPDIYKAGKRFLNDPRIKEYLEEKAKTIPACKDILDFMERNGEKDGLRRTSKPHVPSPKTSVPGTCI